ncbi:hypothetical protein F4774DRAFT_396846 [Daldinia eschscholtzii]|nr:hypothetical protein F4774DRAFT_396846 [Daldinia eschscholtzii]
MLNARNIKTKRPAKKPDKKMLGPFKILKVLKKADPIEAEDYHVDEICDSIQAQGSAKYLVKWEGWPAKRRHWT